MNTDMVALKIREANTLLGNMVSGAISIPSAEDRSYHIPCAWVIPWSENAGDNQADSEILQELFEEFVVVVAYDNSADKPGFAASNQKDTYRAAVFSALLGWWPTGYKSPITYVSGRLVRVSLPIVFYELKFRVFKYITQVDGIGTPDGDDFNKAWIRHQMDELDLTIYGDFSDDSAWTKGPGWSISDGKAVCDGSQGADSDLEQDLERTYNGVTYPGIEAGKKYNVQLKIENYQAGTLTPMLGTGAGTALDSDGIHNLEITAATDTVLRLRASADFAGKLDFVAVRDAEKYIEINA